MERAISWEQILEILTKTREKISNIKSCFLLDTKTEGFTVYRLQPHWAKKLFNVNEDEVRIEIVEVREFGTPHLHRFAEAGFLLLGKSLGFENPKGTLLLGTWNENDTSVLEKYKIKTDLIVRVPPLLVHGFKVTNPIWFLGVHTPLIHENNDLEVVDYKISRSKKKEYVLVS